MAVWPVGGGFEPAVLLRDPHLQTIVAELLPRRIGTHGAPWRAARQEVLFEMPDGDRLQAFVHLQPADPDRARPAVLHLHGLEGNADCGAQRGFSAKAFAVGFHSVRLNFRNCGGTEALARDFYYGSKTGDLATVVEQLEQRWGFKTLYVTGISLGANLLLRYLADLPAPGRVAGAVAISAPIEMDQVLEALSRPMNRIYDRIFLSSLKRKIRRKLRLSPDGARLAPYVAQMALIRTLSQWDEAITAPLGGFESAAAYYRAGSSGPDLGRIGVPTLIIHAQDDPFIPFGMFEQHDEAIRANPALQVLYPQRGGHAAFLGRKRGPLPWMDRHWAENQAIAFLASQAGREP